MCHGDNQGGLIGSNLRVGLFSYFLQRAGDKDEEKGNESTLSHAVSLMHNAVRLCD